MSIWLILGWDTVLGNWEVVKVLFDAAAVRPAVAEIFAECSNYEKLRVKCWHREGWDASYYGTKEFHKEDMVG